VKRFFVVFLPLLLCLSASAGDPLSEKRFSGKAELAFVDTSGNTDVASISAKSDLALRLTETLEGGWKFDVLYGEDGSVKTAESYSTALRLNYRISKRFFTGLAAGWAKDEFTGIDSRVFAGFSAGYRPVESPPHTLKTEIGLDAVREEYTDGTDKDFPQSKIRVAYGFAFSEKNRFTQEVEYLQDLDRSVNYRVRSETALIAAVNGILSLKTHYTVDYDNEPVPATLDDTDSVLGVTLVFNL
jgi:putative salt-induced outer membrane protein